MAGLLPLLFSCSSPDSGGPDDETADTQDSAVVGTIDLTITGNDVGTAVEATWTTPEAADTTLVVTPDGGEPFEVQGKEEEDGLSHVVWVAGLGAGTSATVEARSASTDGATWASEPIALTLPPRPTELAPLALVTEPTTAPADFILSSQVNEGKSAAFAFNGRGEVVWWQFAPTPDDVITSFEVARDGAHLQYLRSGTESTIVRTTLDDLEHVEIPANDAHHDFLELPEGGFLYIASDHRVVDGVMVKGDQVIEINALGGSARTVWSVWDTMPYDGTSLIDTGADGELDWSHANGLAYDESTDTLLVSLYGLATVMAVSRADGGVRWSIGVHGNLTALDGASFEGQHSPQFVEGGVLLFENHFYSEVDEVSRAVEFAVDPDAGTWREAWAWDAGGDWFANRMGNATRQPDGHTFVCWGPAGHFTEVTAEGELLWQIDALEGGEQSYGFRTPRLPVPP